VRGRGEAVPLCEGRPEAAKRSHEQHAASTVSHQELQPPDPPAEERQPDQTPPEPLGKTRVLETLACLREWHPSTFAAPDTPRRPPLKRGIHADIIARIPAINPSEVRAALAYYVRGLSYLHALTEGAARIDLDGAEAGSVTAEEAANAKTHIAAIKKRLRERKAAAKPVTKPTRAAAATPVPKPAPTPPPPPPAPKPAPPKGKGAARPPSGPVIVVRLKRRGSTP
jgi:ProP effector